MLNQDERRESVVLELYCRKVECEREGREVEASHDPMEVMAS